MKSIKEKSEDLYPDKKVVLARGNTCLSCGRVKRESFEEGANYVLEQVEMLLNSQRFVDNPSEELFELIDNLKSNKAI